jgi:hypothetical protein
MLGDVVAGPIPVIADVPRANPGLGFAEYVEALADAIRGGQPPQFTIGLYGAWGSGKSSLLLSIADALGQQRSGVTPVLFDAWRYERSDHLVVPLLHKVHTTLLEQDHRKVGDAVKRAISSIIFSLSFSIGGAGIDFSKTKDAWEASDPTPLDLAFAKPFADLERVSDSLADHRIAVLIDDLDRCSPAKAVSVLEAINLILDIPGFIFVLALDYDVMVSLIEREYPHVSGHVFVEKMIQLPFRVPPLDVARATFLAELAPGWSEHLLDASKGFGEHLAEVSALALERNPRQIKRLLNSLLLIERIIERRGIDLDLELLASVVALQLRWPVAYRCHL